MMPLQDDPKPRPRFDQLNIARQRIIRRNLSALQQKGASDDEVEAYLRDDEGLASANEQPAPPARTLPPETGAERAAGPLMAIAQGGTANFADELAGGLHAVTRLANGKPFGENYREGRDAVRGLMDSYGQRHHKEKIALEMAGGLAPATTIPVLKNLGAVKGGAAFGAAYGAGGAEGDLSDRLLGAGVGAGAGAVGGALVEHAVAPIVAAGIRKAAPLIDRAAPVVSQIGNFLESRGIGLSTRDVSGASAPPNATRATSAARPFARMQETAEAYAAPTSRDRAASAILRNIEKDKRTPGAMLADAQAAPLSEPLTALELADENVMGAARAARGIPSEAKRDIPQALIERQKGERGRARVSMEKASGVTPGDAELLDAEILSKIEEKAGPHYDKAFAHGAISEDSQKALGDLLQDRDWRSFYREARKLADKEGHALPRLRKATVQDSKVLGANGRPMQRTVWQLEEVPDVRTVDYMKRVSDDVIQGKIRQGPGQGGITYQTGKALTKQKNTFLKRLDVEVPDYGQARNIAKSQYDIRRAMKMGQKFLTADDRQVTRFMAKSTDGEKEAYAKMAMDAVNKVLKKGGDTHDVYNRVFGNEAKRDALKALVGDEKFAGLEQEMNAMARRTRSLRFVTTGSNSVDKLGEQIDLESDALVKMLDAGTSPKRAVLQGLRTWIQNRRDGITKKTADDIGRMLTAGAAGGPEGRAALIDVLTELQSAAKRNASRTATRRSAAPLTRPFASQSGGATAPRNERR